MSPKDRNRAIGDMLMNNAMFIIIAIAVVGIWIAEPTFLSIPSIVNIINLTAAKLPIALGVGGCIILAGTDISAGRVVGLSACIAAGLQLTTNKLFPGLPVMPIPVAILAVLVVGACVGFVNGFFMAKFKLHPFIVTLSTQLIVYGIILIYMQLGTNSGQTLSGMSEAYRNFVTGKLFTVGNTAVPRYVLYSAIIAVVVWVIWNKTTFGKNMYAVGSNEDAANVSGVNVLKTIIMVFMLAGMLYGLTGFMDAARIASVNANTGLNYESDAIAACVIGGISFVGGIGKVSGAIIGVLLLQLIFVGLNYLSVDQNLLYIVKGVIILVACSIDMRKYLVRK
ncbi:MAG TPA: beta-methylgalactoside transporter [Candidatus Faecousia intestinavium]|nr:beta-methylgalactoside transporter [Candidatus Faecousia intestinavium]